MVMLSVTMKMLQTVWLVLLGAAMVLGENKQLWSEQAYNGESFNLTCLTNDFTLIKDDRITWTKHGSPTPITTDDHYLVRGPADFPSVQLVILEMTDDMAGIYMCQVRDSTTGDLKYSLVRGVNLGPIKYHNQMDKYKEGIYIGIIAGACVFAFIISICVIGRFRYLSEESLEKRRTRKENSFRVTHQNFEGSRASYHINGDANDDFTTRY